METSRGHTVEIHEEVPTGEKITTSKLYCGEVVCGLSESGSKGGDGGSDRSASIRKLLIAVGLCVIFMSVEVVGGIKANSLAILTDAAHLLSDVAAFAISLFSLWAAGWEATPHQTYGFFRIEILGALLSIQLIWLLAGILVYEAILRLLHNTGQVNGFLMFLIAAFGLVVNVGMALLLGHDHGHSHGHGHGHSHGNSHSHGHSHGHGDQHHQDASDSHIQTRTVTLSHHDHDHQTSHTEPLVVKKQKKKRNINVQGAYLHVLGDSIQSVGVMIGGAIIWWKPEWKIIDVICTLIFSVIVLGTTVKMIRDILEVLMESAPREIDATKLNAGLLEIEGVVAVHDLHIWAITVGKILLSCHVNIAPHADADAILDKVIKYIQTEYNISHVTIQIERTS